MKIIKSVNNLLLLYAKWICPACLEDNRSDICKPLICEHCNEAFFTRTYTIEEIKEVQEIK